MLLYTWRVITSSEMEDSMNDFSSMPGSKRSGSKDVQYFQTFYGPQLRPNARMPIEAHRECGRLLHEVARATEGRRSAHEAVKHAYHTLDD